MRNKLIQFLLPLIILLSFILRFWDISQIPPSLSHDEVAIGYNAWSILKTGKDEYGTRYPLLFRSFDDYKLPGYIYSTVISEELFGLNEVGVRFPSVILGSLTVLCLFFLCKEIFHNKKEGLLISIISTVVLAISPWHINFSRTAFEANASLFFIVLGFLSLLKSRKKPQWLIVSSVSFVVSLYFYYTARILIPFCVLSFLVVYKDKFIVAKKWIVISALFGILLLLSIFPYFLTTGLSRVNQVSIFNDKSLTNPYSEAILRNNNSYIAKIFYNRRLAYLQEFLDNYLKNFAPDFYFATGTGPMGLLYIWELPFFLYGIFLLFKEKDKIKWIILIWFFAVPLAGGLTTGQPNALRTLPNVVPSAIFTGVGLYYFYERHKKNKPIFVGLSFVILFFFLRFLVLYFDYQANKTSISWGDGHKQLSQFLKENNSKYKSIYITGEYWKPYIYILFYTAYNPSLYQKFGTQDTIDTMHFGSSWDTTEVSNNLAYLDFSTLPKDKTLLVLTPSDYKVQEPKLTREDLSYKLKRIGVINGIHAKNVFYLFELQKK